MTPRPHCSHQLSAVAQDARRKMIAMSLPNKTMHQYRKKYDMVMREIGLVSYEGLILFAARNTTRQPTTMKQIKSACVKILAVEGETLTVEENNDLDIVFDGCYNQMIDKPEGKQRGHMTEDRLCQFTGMCYELGEDDAAEGAMAMYEGTTRVHEIPKMTAEMLMLDHEPPFVLVENKTNLRTKHKEGWYQPHILRNPVVIAVLRRRAAKYPTGPLFPQWSYRHVCDYVKDAAVRFEWPDSLKWDGPYVIRHGKAVDTMQDIFRELGTRTMAWKGTSAKAYGDMLRDHPLNVSARRNKGPPTTTPRVTRGRPAKRKRRA